MARSTPVLIAAVSLVICLLLASTGSAAITLNLNTEFSGATPPAGPTPWLTAVFADTGVDEVTLTMTALNLTGSEFVKEWGFNLNPAMSAASLTITSTGGEAALTVAMGTDIFKADGDGFYDILFNFDTSPPSDRFTAGDTSVYKLTMAGLDETDFDFLSSPGGGAGTFKSAAHVLGIAPDGSNSGWIGVTGPNTQDPPVPEPATLLIWSLLGAVTLGACHMRRRRRAV